MARPLHQKKPGSNLVDNDTPKSPRGICPPSSRVSDRAWYVVLHTSQAFASDVSQITVVSRGFNHPRGSTSPKIVSCLIVYPRLLPGFSLFCPCSTRLLVMSHFALPPFLPALHASQFPGLARETRTQFLFRSNPSQHPTSERTII